MWPPTADSRVRRWGEPSQRGHVVGRPAWKRGSTAASLPLSSCLTSWGVSRHLTINLQDSGIFPGSFLSPFLLRGPRKSGPRKPERPEGLTHLSALCPSPTPGTTLPLPAGFATLSRPQLSPAPDFPVPGSGGAWALGVVVRTLAGGPCGLGLPCCLPLS